MNDINYIGIIDDSPNWEGGDIRLEPSNKQIQYRDSDGSIITIDNNSSPNRASRGSDLNKLLIDRNYNLLDSKVVISDQLGGSILAWAEYDESGNLTPNPIYTPEIKDEVIAEFTGLYENLMDINWDKIPFYNKNDNWMENNDIMYKEDGSNKYKYYNFRMIRDFVNKSTVVNVMSMSNSIYTDTINMNTVRSSISGDKFDINYSDESKELINAKIGIQYSTNDGIVNTKNIMFPLNDDFKYIFDEVELEYVDGCIRLFPLTENVIECIISQCYLYYERIL